MLMSVTEQGSQVVWDLESQDPATFGQTDRLVVDQAVISRLVFSVDYVWISHTFAATFLVICYLRGAIDGKRRDPCLDPFRLTIPDNLQIIALASDPRGPPRPARRESLLSRLITLACDIFDAICASCEIHPATDYRAIVRNAAASIRMPSSPLSVLSASATSGSGSRIPHTLDPGVLNADMMPPPETSYSAMNHSTAELDGDMALQSLFDMMAENGMEWSVNLMSSDTVTGSTDHQLV
jgi:hypothetical protein